MAELEAKLRALASRGELTYLSVVPVAGKQGAGVTFVAQVSPASRFGHVEGRDADPVAALLLAIDGLPKAMRTDKPRREARTVGEVTAVQNGDPMPEPVEQEEREPWDV